MHLSVTKVHVCVWSLLLIVYWYSSPSCNINLDQICLAKLITCEEKKSVHLIDVQAAGIGITLTLRNCKQKENSWKMISLRYFPVSVGCILTYNYVWMKDVKLNLTFTNISFPETVNMLFCILYVWWMIWHFLLLSCCVRNMPL